MPSGRHAVCLVSRNHELRAPDLSVKSPRLTECASTWSRSAGERLGQRGKQRRIGIGRERYRRAPVNVRADVPDRPTPHLHRAPAGRDVRRPAGRRPAGRALGFGAFFRSDHYLAMGGRSSRRLPGPTDAWMTLAGLARDTYDDPARHARHVGDVPARRAAGDHRGRRRPDVGRPGRARARRRVVRARARGLRHPVPDLGDALRPPRGAAGDHHRAVGDAVGRAVLVRRPRTTSSPTRPALPKPVQAGGIPIIVGGGGPTRTPALGRPLRAEFNIGVPPPSSVRRRSASGSSTACEAIERDPASITWSAAASLCVGADEAEFAARAAAIGREPDELRRNGVAGTPDEVRATCERWAAAGADRHLPPGARPLRPRPPRRSSPPLPPETSSPDLDPWTRGSRASMKSECAARHA